MVGTELGPGIVIMDRPCGEIFKYKTRLGTFNSDQVEVLKWHHSGLQLAAGFSDGTVIVWERCDTVESNWNQCRSMVAQNSSPIVKLVSFERFSVQMVPQQMYLQTDNSVTKSAIPNGFWSAVRTEPGFSFGELASGWLCISRAAEVSLCLTEFARDGENARCWLAGTGDRKLLSIDVCAQPNGRPRIAFIADDCRSVISIAELCMNNRSICIEHLGKIRIDSNHVEACAIPLVCFKTGEKESLYFVASSSQSSNAGENIVKETVVITYSISRDDRMRVKWECQKEQSVEGCQVNAVNFLPELNCISFESGSDVHVFDCNTSTLAKITHDISIVVDTKFARNYSSNRELKTKHPASIHTRGISSFSPNGMCCCLVTHAGAKVSFLSMAEYRMKPFPLSLAQAADMIAQIYECAVARGFSHLDVTNSLRSKPVPAFWTGCKNPKEITLEVVKRLLRRFSLVESISEQNFYRHAIIDVCQSSLKRLQGLNYIWRYYLVAADVASMWIIFEQSIFQGEVGDFPNYCAPSSKLNAQSIPGEYGVLDMIRTYILKAHEKPEYVTATSQTYPKGLDAIRHLRTYAKINALKVHESHRAHCLAAARWIQDCALYILKSAAALTINTDLVNDGPAALKSVVLDVTTLLAAVGLCLDTQDNELPLPELTCVYDLYTVYIQGCLAIQRMSDQSTVCSVLVAAIDRSSILKSIELPHDFESRLEGRAGCSTTAHTGRARSKRAYDLGYCSDHVSKRAWIEAAADHFTVTNDVLSNKIDRKSVV